MSVYLAGKVASVVVTPLGGDPVTLAVPVQFEGEQLKTGSIYVTDNGRKVVFVEFYYDSENPPVHQGQLVSLDITGIGKDVHIQQGILDIVGTESRVKNAVKAFIVVAELSSGKDRD
jgi:hypothetical protein